MLRGSLFIERSQIVNIKKLIAGLCVFLCAGMLSAQQPSKTDTLTRKNAILYSVFSDFHLGPYRGHLFSYQRNVTSVYSIRISGSYYGRLSTRGNESAFYSGTREELMHSGRLSNEYIRYFSIFPVRFYCGGGPFLTGYEYGRSSTLLSYSYDYSVDTTQSGSLKWLWQTGLIGLVGVQWDILPYLGLFAQYGHKAFFEIVQETASGEEDHRSTSWGSEEDAVRLGLAVSF